MAQGVLPFKYEMDGQGVAMTGLGGSLTYLDLAQAIGLSRSIELGWGKADPVALQEVWEE